MNLFFTKRCDLASHYRCPVAPGETSDVDRGLQSVGQAAVFGFRA